MSFQALNNALSGLRVAQQQLTTISNNVSNATTPGYTRKILPQSTQVVNNTGQSFGVLSDPEIRNVDLNLESQLWTQVSSVSELTTKASYLDQIEKFHGTTNSESSIAAQISALKDKFAALSDSPSDGSLQQQVLDSAQTVATTFNQYGQLVTQLRNDAQDEMSQTVDRVNALLNTVAGLNKDIKNATNLNRTTAALEDQRDIAVNELAGYMNITQFRRGDGVMVLQTTTGVQLADERATEVFFKPGVIGPTTTYPTDPNAAGIYVGGDPTRNARSFDITPTNVGGKLGALIDMRDKTLVQYQAQVDEMAQKLSLRLNAQGLTLFTDPTGQVPADTPPDPTTVPPTSVTYVGYATSIQVNKSIISNINLLQKGTFTSDVSIPAGSNDIIRRVIQFGFGTVDHQEIDGTTDLNVSAPATDLQTWLGLPSQNTVVGGIDLSKFPQIDDGNPSTADIADTLQQFFPNWPADSQFQITFEEPRLGLGPTTINIDLSQAQTDFPLGPGVTNALDQIVSEVNQQIAAAGLPAGLTASATRNSSGQLSIQSNGNVTLDASSFAGSMGTQAFGALGFTEKTYNTEDPYFDIQVGTGTAYRIAIEPGDTVTDLVNKLVYNPVSGTGVPGLNVTYNAGTGALTLRPGIDSSNGGPSYGGDMKIIAGGAQTSGAVNPALAALPSSVNIVSALFGSYSVSGGAVSQTSPIVNVNYGSETQAGSGVFVPFREKFLGPGADVTSGVTTGQNIIDFAQKTINAQAQDVVLNDSQKSDATTLHDLLNTRFLGESSVNIDEELSTLIVVQTAYAAAARAVSAASDMFDELLNAI